ncbi:MAG TPA: efflux RND transporter periplasmic adaptor subunit [Bacillota bacterium]|nr:efflux RND transporter periplasmic adaptor subunit [Bacillota bacterium]
MKSSHLYKLLAVTVLTSSFAFMETGCNSAAPASGQELSGISVKVIKLGSSTTDANLSGKIVVDQQVKVVSKISGKIASVNAKEGTVVKKGDVIVQLETGDFEQKISQAQAAVAIAQAQLADAKAGARQPDIDQANSGISTAKAAIGQAKAALDNAQTNYDRTKALFDAGAAPQSSLDSTTTDLESKKAAYSQAEAGLSSSQAKLDLLLAGPRPDAVKALEAAVSNAQAALDIQQSSLKDATIVAPLDGIVTEKSMNPGEMAAPGVPLLTVVNMNNVFLQVSVSQNQITQVKQGDDIDVYVDGVEKPFKGVIDYVSPLSDATNNTFPVKIKIDNTSGALRAGMIAKVALDSSQKGIEVPKSALVQKDNKNYVYKLDGNIVHLVEVNPQEKDKDWVFVKNGLIAKDQVVINPSSQLTDGAKVLAN